MKFGHNLYYFSNPVLLIILKMSSTVTSLNLNTEVVIFVKQLLTVLCVSALGIV